MDRGGKHIQSAIDVKVVVFLISICCVTDGDTVKDVQLGTGNRAVDQRVLGIVHHIITGFNGLVFIAAGVGISTAVQIQGRASANHCEQAQVTPIAVFVLTVGGHMTVTHHIEGIARTQQESAGGII